MTNHALSVPRLHQSVLAFVALILILLTGTARAQDPFTVTTGVDIFQTSDSIYTDAVRPGTTVELFWTVNGSHVFTGGISTLTLPPCMTHVSSRVATGKGTVAGSGQKVTMQVAPDNNYGRIEVRVFARIAAASTLPDSPEMYQLVQDANVTHATRGTASQQRSQDFCILYTKPQVYTFTQGTVKSGDIITYNVTIPAYKPMKMYSARLTLSAPNNTDIVLGSLSGNQGGTVTENNSQIVVNWGTDAPRNHQVSFNVKVRDRTAINPSITEISCDKVSYSLTIETPNRINVPTGSVHTRTSLTTAPAVIRPFKTSLDLELGFDRRGVAVNGEFKLKAKLTNNTPWNITDAKLDTTTFTYGGEGLAEPVAVTPPAGVALAPGQTKELEYRFKATRLGKMTISAIGTGQAFTYQNFKISTERTTSGWLCVGCSGVGVEILLPDEGFATVDTPFTATVEVTSYEAAPQMVTFPQGIMTAESPDRVQVDAPEVAPFQLTGTDPVKRFEVLITPRKLGTAVVRSDAEVLAGGVTTYPSDTADVIVTPLKITFKVKPLVNGKPTVNMLLKDGATPADPPVVTDMDGKPITPTVEVTVTNMSDQPATASITSMDPLARDKSALVAARIAVTGAVPFDLGSIAAGESKSREFGLAIKANGRFQFQALVTGRTQGAADSFTANARGGPIAVGVPYPVEVELDFVESPDIVSRNNGAVLITPGSKLRVIAKIQNKLTNSTLHFHGIRAEKRGNVLDAVITDDNGNLTDPPLDHPHEVDAVATAVLTGKILTEGDGAPAGTVRWEMLEKAYFKDDDTGEKKDVSKDDILVTSTAGGWLGDDFQVRVIQDYRRTTRNTDISGVEEVGYWTYGAMLGVAGWMYDSIDAVGGIGRAAGYISGNPEGAYNEFGDASKALWDSVEYAQLGWQSMTPAQKDQFVLGICDEVQRRARLMGENGVPFDANDFTQVYTFTKNATYGLFGNIEAAYATDDRAVIAQELGKVSGNIAMEVATATLPTPKFSSYTKTASLTRMAEANALGKAMNVQETFLRAVKAGLVDEATTIKHWGIGGENLQDIQKVFEYFKVKGYCRERGPEAYRLIDQLGEAVWKPEAMKPKGLSDVDILILNNDLPPIPGKNGNMLDAEGITAIFLPEPDDVIAARLRSQGYPQDVVDVALARASMRREEFYKYVPEFESWARPVADGGGLPIKKNYVDNGIPDPGHEQGPNRAFRFDRHRREGKPTIYIPKMMTADGTGFKYISGDIDWIHFTFLDGSPLDNKTVARLYDALSRSCGFQHPETISWIMNGKNVFAAKANQLVDYLGNGPGQKALLEITGKSTSAVRVKENLSRFSDVSRKHYIHFDGGLKSRARATAADIENALAWMQRELPDRRSLLPFLWGNDESEPSVGGNNDWSYSTSGNPSIIRGSNGSNVEVFNGTSWTSVNPATLPAPLNIAPASSLSANVSPGAGSVMVDNLPALWPEELAGHVIQWFAVGQIIIIEPGTPRQEIRRITGINPITLDKPLLFSHRLGDMVSFLPAQLYAATDRVTYPRLLRSFTVPATKRMTIDFAVSSTAPSYFEASTNLTTWTPLEGSAISGGVAAGNQRRAAYPGEILSVDLNTGAAGVPRRFVRVRR